MKSVQIIKKHNHRLRHSIKGDQSSSVKIKVFLVKTLTTVIIATYHTAHVYNTWQPSSAKMSGHNKLLFVLLFIGGTSIGLLPFVFTLPLWLN